MSDEEDFDLEFLGDVFEGAGDLLGGMVEGASELLEGVDFSFLSTIFSELPSFRQTRNRRQGQKRPGTVKARSKKKAAKAGTPQYARDLTEAFENIFVALSIVVERLQQFGLVNLKEFRSAQSQFTATFSRTSPHLIRAYKGVPQSLKIAVVVGCSFLSMLIPELQAVDKDAGLPKSIILGMARAALIGNERDETFLPLYPNACQIVAEACGRLSFSKVGQPLFPTFPTLATGLPWASKPPKYRSEVKKTYEILIKYLQKYGVPEPKNKDNVSEFVDWQFGYYLIPKLVAADKKQRTLDPAQCKLPEHDEQAKGGVDFGGFIVWLLLGAEGTVRGCASIFFQERELEILKWIGNAPGFIVLYGNGDFWINSASKKVTPEFIEAFGSWAIVTRPKTRATVVPPPPPVPPHQKPPANKPVADGVGVRNPTSKAPAVGGTAPQIASETLEPEESKTKKGFAKILPKRKPVEKGAASHTETGRKVQFPDSPISLYQNQPPGISSTAIANQNQLYGTAHSPLQHHRYSLPPQNQLTEPKQLLQQQPAFQMPVRQAPQTSPIRQQRMSIQTPPMQQPPMQFAPANQPMIRQPPMLLHSSHQSIIRQSPMQVHAIHPPHVQSHIMQHQQTQQAPIQQHIPQQHSNQSTIMPQSQTPYMSMPIRQPPMSTQQQLARQAPMLFPSTQLQQVHQASPKMPSMQTQVPLAPGSPIPQSPPPPYS